MQAEATAEVLADTCGKVDALTAQVAVFAARGGAAGEGSSAQMEPRLVALESNTGRALAGAEAAAAVLASTDSKLAELAGKVAAAEAAAARATTAASQAITAASQATAQAASVASQAAVASQAGAAGAAGAAHLEQARLTAVEADARRALAGAEAMASLFASSDAKLAELTGRIAAAEASAQGGGGAAALEPRLTYVETNSGRALAGVEAAAAALTEADAKLSALTARLAGLETTSAATSQKLTFTEAGMQALASAALNMQSGMQGLQSAAASAPPSSAALLQQAPAPSNPQQLQLIASLSIQIGGLEQQLGGLRDSLASVTGRLATLESTQQHTGATLTSLASHSEGTGASDASVYND